jgi:uncharacterized membrane protein YebE (DUF533 family)
MHKPLEQLLKSGQSMIEGNSGASAGGDAGWGNFSAPVPPLRRQGAEPGQRPSACSPTWPIRTGRPSSMPSRAAKVAVLQSMIAAAKADGHLDERERGRVEVELRRIEADVGRRRWFEDELRKPRAPAEVARAAGSPEIASEMYLASLLVADDTSFMESAYLDELALQPQLP